MGRLDGKVCLITGAARGQGAAEAGLFAREGATVWLADVLDAQGERLAQRIGGTYRHLDVSDEGGWTALVAELMARDGRVDVLVNNAGIFRGSRLLETSTEEFARVMDVNCKGVFLGMRAVAGPMREAGAGSIVNVSSLAGLVGAAGAFAYAASKWAVRGMTKSAAVELARRGVRVNSIHPGLIDTDMADQLGASRERLARGIPLGRAASAEEVANLALYLASDESSYSTGSEFIVDGGMNAL
jgi:3alpha(or 20beta)-hydroxysteroid dehydrogenase